MKYITAAAALATSVLLTACGGGDGPGTESPQPPVLSRACTGETDSSPSSLGADGWAAATGTVTGGCGALEANVHVVTNRQELVKALYAGKASTTRPDGTWERPDETPKIIYVRGTIDLNVDANNNRRTEEDYMRDCGYTAHATYYDPATQNEAGNGGFFGAYKAAYDPNTWNRQDAVPRAGDGRLSPPVLTGPLEDARACFQQAQQRVVVVRVGSNTSIVGIGTDARIVRGNLRLGWARTLPADATRPDTANYKAKNVVIRNVTFEDPYDMFPAWDPQDSFSMPAPSSSMPYLADCQATYDAAAGKGPHKCRGGRWNAEYDAISIENAEQAWVDHNSFSDGTRPDRLSPGVWTTSITFNARTYQPFNESTQKVQHHDGLLDVILAGTAVTASYNHFHDHDKTNLLGGSDLTEPVSGYGPGKINVTFHHNFWQNTVQRMPRVRFGEVHVYNNYYAGTRASGGADYLFGEAWTLGTAAKIFAESNLFEIGGTVTPANLVGFNSILSNGVGTSGAPGACVQAGFSAAECGTYFYEVGNVLNGTVQNFFSAAQVKATGTAGNATLQSLDPTNPAVFWIPSRSYGYTAVMPTATGTDQATLKTWVTGKAGAGKL